MKKLLILYNIFLFSNINAQLPEPYASLKLLPYKMQSLCSPWCKTELKRLIEEHDPKIVVEIGSWLGGSAIYMAKLLGTNAKLYAVDTWLGSIQCHQEATYSVHLPTLYQQFLSNCVHQEVAHKIIPIRMSSCEAKEALDIKIDLIYIDGSHDGKDVFDDIMWWHPKMAPDGKICGDDYGWPGLAEAVHRAANILGFKVKTNQGFWEFE